MPKNSNYFRKFLGDFPNKYLIMLCRTFQPEMLEYQSNPLRLVWKPRIQWNFEPWNRHDCWTPMGCWCYRMLWQTCQTRPKSRKHKPSSYDVIYREPQTQKKSGPCGTL